MHLCGVCEGNVVDRPLAVCEPCEAEDKEVFESL